LGNYIAGKRSFHEETMNVQSRYYNPEWGRFLNTDALISTGQGFLCSSITDGETTSKYTKTKSNYNKE